MISNLDKPATQSEHGSMPSIEFRLQTCRLLVQIEKYKPAIQVLELLVKEDDELVEAWYLLAFSFFKRSKWENAKECCLSLHNTCTKNKIMPDKELQTATKEIYDSVVAKLAEEDKPNPEKDGMYDSNSGFEDCSDSDLSSDAEIQDDVDMK